MELGADGKWYWSEAEKQQKREINQNLVWITDDIKSVRVEKNSVIPEGWKVGRAIDWQFGSTYRSEESNRKRSETLKGRPSPNKGHTSPKKGLTEVEYYGEEKAAELAKLRSETHSGQKPWNYGIPRTDEEKKNISAAKTGVSTAAKGVPKDYDVWNTGKREAKGRSSFAALDWSKEVLSRDENKCQHCGRTEELHTHHIKSWKLFPLLRFELSNGLSLCGRCHYWLESMIRELVDKLGQVPAVFEIHLGEFACSICHRLTTPKEGITPCSCKS